MAKKCGDCLHYDICGQWVEPSETFPEIDGGCKVFKGIADYVKVVRCKDCAYYLDEYCGERIGMVKKCETFEFFTKEDDFCSFGWRKEN